MKIFAAALQSESNTFSPWPTGWNAFKKNGISRGEAAMTGSAPDRAVGRLWRDLAGSDGYDFTASVFAWAEPLGPTVQSVYESFREQILEDLSANGGADIVLLYLHGAMIATECDDCEADLVKHVRNIVGPEGVIGVELDPHCHLSTTLLDLSDLVILMKEYPHDDYIERARELYDLCLATRRGGICPVSTLFDCHMVGFYPTTQEPMAGIVTQLKEEEKAGGVLSVSFAHGFPWGDTPDSGSRLLVIADDDKGLAQQTAERIGLDIYKQREVLLPHFPSIDDAIDEALVTPGMVILADIADNPGGGAPGDNTTLLRTLVERGINNAAVGAIWDPVVAEICAEAGIGTRLRLRLGGKCGSASGEPFDLEAIVHAVCDDHWQTGLGGASSQLGLSAWIEIDGIDVVVNSLRTQVFDPKVFTGLGIKLENKKIVSVKSSQHFHSRFAPIASKVIRVLTPGALDMNFAQLSYVKKTDMNYYPRIHAPLG